MIYVDAQYLAVIVIHVLRAIAGIIGRAAVPLCDVKKAVLPKLDHPAIVVGERLLSRDDGDFIWIGNIGVQVGRVVFGDYVISVGLSRVIDEESMVPPELRMKGESQQPLFAAKLNERRNIQELCRHTGPW